MEKITSIRFNVLTKLWLITLNSGYSFFISINGNEIAGQHKLTVELL